MPLAFHAQLPCRPTGDEPHCEAWEYDCLLSIAQSAQTDRFNVPARLIVTLPESVGREEKKRQLNSVIDLLLRERFIAHRGCIDDLCVRDDATGNGIGVTIELSLPDDGELVLETFEAA